MNKRKKIQNILCVGLSYNWNSLERCILWHTIVLKHEGRKPFLYCYKNSNLAFEAIKKGIDVIHPKKAPTDFFQWRIFLGLPSIVRKFDIELVHFYQINFIWPLCFFLYRVIEIPLVMTVNNEIKRFYNNILYRTLVYRVDMFLCPFEGFRKNIASHLMVKLKKTSCLGMATLCSGVQKRAKKELESKGKNGLRMGVFCKGDKKEQDHLKIVLHALTVFNKKLDQPIFLELISEENWENNPTYKYCRELSWEYQIGDWISFRENNTLLECGADFDLWVGLPRQEDFEDLSIWTLLQGIPLLTPRTGISMEFFESCHGCGECYKSGDGREFWQKGLQMLQKIDFYKKRLEQHSEQIRESCDASDYAASVLEIYDGLGTRRWAYQKTSQSSRT